MYCGSCGKQVPDGNRFCNHCGAPVTSAGDGGAEKVNNVEPQQRGAQPIVPPAFQPNAQYGVRSSDSKSQKTGLVGWIVTIAMILTAVLTVYMALAVVNYSVSSEERNDWGTTAMGNELVFVEVTVCDDLTGALRSYESETLVVGATLEDYDQYNKAELWELEHDAIDDYKESAFAWFGVSAAITVCLLLLRLNLRKLKITA